jgi:Uma2 family endonuclease
MVAVEQPRVHYGQIIATNVSEAEYMEKYAALYCEWVNGVVIKMSPASLRHNEIIAYIYMLLKEYFASCRTGRVVLPPFVMRLSDMERREPDLLVVLKTNPYEMTGTEVQGPADICIEVVSPESIERDRGEKFAQYERYGVREYWLLDPLRNEALFYVLNVEGTYEPQSLDENGNYRTNMLPAFALHVPTLWLDEMPSPGEVSKAIQAMLSHEG